MTRVIKPIHPFPARMAPQLAIDAISKLQKASAVLDPMCGSGTVARHASEFGHRTIAFDTDPLAVLMTKVWTTPIKSASVMSLCEKVIDACRGLASPPKLPWMDQETVLFIRYWFGKSQRDDLCRLAFVLDERYSKTRSVNRRNTLEVLRLALSRIIITKEKGASLGRDVSHSRPHKVLTRSNFQVFPQFQKSVARLCAQLTQQPPTGEVKTELGDARALTSVANASIDMVLTSPPYLNAIDYLRGHRLALVWLGYALPHLRAIRSNSIGSERGTVDTNSQSTCAFQAIGNISGLSSRHKSMIARYTTDVCSFMSEVARVLKPDGKAILVVGNSCLKGRFVRNADAVIAAAISNGMKVFEQVERELPHNNRYLPMPSRNDNPLGKRIRTESLLGFCFA